tara:strand:- start:2864 stop:3697 length:834 start_codon:yes stop_codon:yes gene_type:complete
MNNLSVVIFTNEKGFGLAELAVDYFKRYSKNLKINIVSNLIPDGYVFRHDDIQHHNMKVPYDSSGGHFGESMLKYLKSIDDEYIFFFCDDYFLVNDIKEDDLNTLIDFIKCENIDYFGFNDMGVGCSQMDKVMYQSKCKHEHSNKFVVRNRDDRYLYSVQPCIWKRETFMKVLDNSMSLHALDETQQHIKDINGIVALGNDLPSHMTYKLQEEINEINYFILSYTELVRHGVFIIPENNQYRSEDEIQTQVVRALCKDETINKKPFFKKLLYNLKLD